MGLRSSVSKTMNRGNLMASSTISSRTSDLLSETLPFLVSLLSFCQSTKTQSRSLAIWGEAETSESGLVVQGDPSFLPPPLPHPPRHPATHLPIHPCIHSSIHVPPIHPPIHSSTHPPHPSMHPLNHPSTLPLSTHPPFHPSSIHPSIMCVLGLCWELEMQRWTR